MSIYIAHTRGTSNALNTNTGRRKMSRVYARMLTQCSQNSWVGLEASFQIVGPATENARRPNVLRRWRSTVSWQRLAECNRWLAMSETGTQQSTRYCGALLWRHRWTIWTVILYLHYYAVYYVCVCSCVLIFTFYWLYVCFILAAIGVINDNNIG